MSGQLVKNESGAYAIWDGQSLVPIQGQVVKNDQTGEYGLWDGKVVKPIPGLEVSATPTSPMPAGPEKQGPFGSLLQGDSPTFPGIPNIPFLASTPIKGENLVERAINIVPETVGRMTGGAAKYLASPLDQPGGIPSFHGTQPSRIAEVTGNLMGQFIVPGLVAKGAVGTVNLAQRGFQKLAPKLPGASLGLRESARKLTEAIPGSILPTQSSNDLYALVREMNPTVTLPTFSQKTAELAAKEAKLQEFGLGSEKIAGVAGKTGKALKETPKQEPRFLGDLFEQGAPPSQLKPIPFSEVETIRRRIGERLGELRKQGGEELGAYKQMFKSLSDDLERAAEEGVGPAFQALKTANKAARREFASGELGEIVTGAIKKREGTDFENISFSQIYNKVKAKTNPASREYDELFAKSFTKQEIDSILKDTFEMSKIPVPPPPKGLNVGSALVHKRAGIGGTLGGLLGGLATGTPMGAIIGGSAGGATGLVGAEVVSSILQSEKGRKFLIKFLNASPHGVNAQNINVLAAFARGITGVNVPPPSQPQ